ncbi:MAG: phosphodiester glycosidase family protein, partial [Traorella sp.]
MKRKVLNLLLAFSVALSSLQLSVFASIDIGTDFGTFKVISSRDYAIAPGVVETDLVLNDDSGTSQNKGYVVEVDMSLSTNSIIAGYKNYDASSWGFQTVTEQAKAAQLAIRNNEKYGENATVVAGINAGFFNMATGEPIGAFVMNGVKIKESTPGSTYLAVLKDGTLEIRDGSQAIDDNVQEAIAGADRLIKNGVISTPKNNSSDLLMPRVALGIKENGNVVILQVDGRQAPTSVGMTLYELAEILLGLGCVEAVNYDGGGSATIATRREGNANLEVVNSPSDGAPREVSSSLFIVSTAKPSGEFDHAAVSPNEDLYTPYSTVTFTAKGVDSAGLPVDLPENVKWQLSDDCVEMGEIDENTGEFQANGNCGTVTVQLYYENDVVGQSNIEIVVPDEISFKSDEISLGFEETTDFNIIVRNKSRDINIKEGDLVWTITDENMGTFNGNVFTSSDGASLNGYVTATSAYDDTVFGTIHVIVGMLPTIVMDFEDYVDPDTGEVTPAKEYYTIGSSGDGSKYYTSNYGRGGKQSAEIVS